MTTIPQITKDCRTAMEKSFEASKRELSPAASAEPSRPSARVADLIEIDPSWTVQAGDSAPGR